MDSFYIYTEENCPKLLKKFEFWEKYDEVWDFLSWVINAGTLAIIGPYLAGVASALVTLEMGAASIAVAFVSKSLLKSSARPIINKLFAAKYRHEAFCGLSFIAFIGSFYWVFGGGAYSYSYLYFEEAQKLLEQSFFYEAKNKINFANAIYENDCYATTEALIQEIGINDYSAAFDLFEKGVACPGKEGAQAVIGILRIMIVRNYHSKDPNKIARMVALAERYYINYTSFKYKTNGKSKKYEALILKYLGWSYLLAGRSEEALEVINASIKINNSIKDEDRDFSVMCLKTYLKDELSAKLSAKICLKKIEKKYGYVDVNFLKEQALKILNQ
ncbi:MAG: hypothetical protein F6J93_25710 [Oscillatoria sp. SIO1A7]|nr:hypothetical protein [Oscillatoria sp. SIO1A7]